MIRPISLAWLEMTPPSWDSGRVRMAFVLGQRGGTSPSGTSGLHPWPESPPSNPEHFFKKTLAKTWWWGLFLFHQFLILFVKMSCVTQAALELSVKPTQASSPQRSFLSQLLNCWDYRHEPPFLASNTFQLETSH